MTPTTLLDALPKLEIISVFGVGYDGVPVDYCRKRGIKVTNTPDVLTDDVADVARRADHDDGARLRAPEPLRAGRRMGKARAGRSRPSSAGKRVGILGLGRIGKAIAERVSAMGMQIAYTGRKPQDVPYRFVPDLTALAAESDFLVVACPGRRGDEEHRQRRACSRRWARRARSSTSRAARSSTSRRWSRRCKPERSRPRASTCSPTSRTFRAPLLAMDNVVLLPHVGSATHETRQAMGDLCKANLDAWFAGKPVLTLIPELA